MNAPAEKENFWQADAEQIAASAELPGGSHLGLAQQLSVEARVCATDDRLE